MYTLTVVIHVSVCFLMIAAILLQAGKGAEIGAAFGGSSQTVFGSRGPAGRSGGEAGARLRTSTPMALRTAAATVTTIALPMTSAPTRSGCTTP